MLEHYQRHTPKLVNRIPKQKTVLSTIQNDLLHEFVDKAIVSFATVFDRVLLQMVGINIASSLFKYRVSYRHLIFMTEIFELLMKSCKNLICYSCIFSVQMHARSLEKVNFKV